MEIFVVWLVELLVPLGVRLLVNFARPESAALPFLVFAVGRRLPIPTCYSMRAILVSHAAAASDNAKTRT